MLAALLAPAHAAEAPRFDASKVPPQMALGCYALLVTAADQPTFRRRDAVDKPLTLAYRAQLQAALAGAGDATPIDILVRPSVPHLRSTWNDLEATREYERCWNAADAGLVQFRAIPELKRALMCYAVEANAAPPDPLLFSFESDLDQASGSRRVGHEGKSLNKQVFLCAFP